MSHLSGIPIDPLTDQACWFTVRELSYNVACVATSIATISRRHGGADVTLCNTRRHAGHVVTEFPNRDSIPRLSSEDTIKKIRTICVSDE